MTNTNEYTPKPAMATLRQYNGEWAVELRGSDDRVLVDDTGCPERMTPYPKNLQKSEREAVRLAKHYNVPACRVSFMSWAQLWVPHA